MKYKSLQSIIISLFFTYLLLIITTNLQAQRREIVGTINNIEDGKPVPDLKVSIKGSLDITTTNQKGEYKLIIPDTIKNIEFHEFTTLKIEEKIIISENEINLIVSKKEVGIYDIPLEELVKIKVDCDEVITASLKLQNIQFAPSNITIVTREMIEQRGYQTLVDICQDIPGFDFLVFNDGGGEYPTYNMNRGLGTIGNTKILIMVDGIIQNSISFNWSLLWTYENLLNDIDRIEIIEGPGSSIYGAQAFSGIIHFITRKNFEGVEVKPFYGSNSTYGADVYLGNNFRNDINLSLAFHAYKSDGDAGLRYDPGNYFHNIQYPDTILSNYDNEGNYITNLANPNAGQAVPDGFQNWHKSYSIRAKLTHKKTEIGFFFWENNSGIGSYIVAYEYDLTAQTSQTATRGFHVYFKNNTNFNDKLSLQSNLVFRSTNILPRTGFSYLYKFPLLVKSYASYAYQSYLEERLVYNFSKKADFLIGAKVMTSLKSPRLISLNYIDADNITETNSAWNSANSGDGLNIKETVPVFIVYEIASYLVINNQWTDKMASSLGIRHDFSKEYGNILNPRMSFIYKPANIFGIKLLYGRAFKQASIFELNSEFRGNPNLKPEKITTYEVELFSKLFRKKIKLKSNIFYSVIKDFIGKVPDETMPSGERYENKNEFFVSGVSFELKYKIINNINFYANYMFLQGKVSDSDEWEQIDLTAKHKINSGINISFFKEKLNINCRVNYVGKRKAPLTNVWLQTYYNGFASSYKKMNLIIGYKVFKYFTFQLIINNLLNEQYYGVGRETGNSFVDDYHYQNNPNPSGFIPSYHPQPGRTFIFNLKFEI